MVFPELYLSVLSFGETGMEFIAGQEVENFEQGQTTLIGNFYSNVLGAAEEEVGLFGPLPVAYRYDLLLFLFVFNSYDPTLTDERVKNNRYITKSTLLMFFPTRLDGQMSNLRYRIKIILEQWCQPFQTREIRTLRDREVTDLANQLKSYLVFESTKSDLSNVENTNFLKVLGRNIYLLDTIGSIHQRRLKLSLFHEDDATVDKLTKHTLLLENTDTLVKFNRENGLQVFEFPHLCIMSWNLGIDHTISSRMIKRDVDGVLLLIQLDDDSVSIGKAKNRLNRVLKETSKKCVVSVCIAQGNGKQLDLSETMIPTILANECDRTISLVDLSEKGNSIERGLLDFLEKVVSKVSNV